MQGNSLKDKLMRNKNVNAQAVGRAMRAMPAPKPEEKAAVVTPDSIHKALFDVMGSLTELLETEKRYLSERNIEGMKSLLPRKYQLISIYQANIKTIAQQAAIVKTAPSEVRLKLKEAGKKLQEVTQTNALALQGAVNGTRRLVDNVMGLIKEEASREKATYQNFRTSSPAAYKDMCAPVAVSRNV